MAKYPAKDQRNERSPNLSLTEAAIHKYTPQSLILRKPQWLVLNLSTRNAQSSENGRERKETDLTASALTTVSSFVFRVFFCGFFFLLFFLLHFDPTCRLHGRAYPAWGVLSDVRWSRKTTHPFWEQQNACCNPG